jgi:hypothetical protein
MGLKPNSTTMSSKKTVTFLITALHASAFTSCDFKKHEQPHTLRTEMVNNLKDQKKMNAGANNQSVIHIMLSKEVFAMSCQYVLASLWK